MCILICSNNKYFDDVVLFFQHYILLFNGQQCNAVKRDPPRDDVCSSILLLVLH